MARPGPGSSVGPSHADERRATASRRRLGEERLDVGRGAAPKAAFPRGVGGQVKRGTRASGPDAGGLRPRQHRPREEDRSGSREVSDAGGLPPRQRRAFSVMRGAIETEGPAEVCHELAALFEVDPRLERDLTHGFHGYAGRMHPQVARGVLARWSASGDHVLDPFCGGGTVLVEAMAAGRVAQGIDASPLAVRLARVRTSVLGTAARVRLMESAREIAEESAARARRRVPVEIPPWARHETMRFSPHVALELLGLRELVMDLPEDGVGRALRLCLSSILVKFMRAGPQAAPDAAEKRIGRGLPSRHFADRAAELALGLEALETRMPFGTPLPDVKIGDARALPLPPRTRFDLVLTSPPYAGVYDYAELHDVRFTWLGLSRAELRATQIGARTRGAGGVAARPWSEARRQWLAAMARVLRPGGHAVLVVGDGVVGGRPEDAAYEIARAARALGLVPAARASQARPPREAALAEIFAGTPRREHLLLLERR